MFFNSNKMLKTHVVLVPNTKYAHKEYANYLFWRIILCRYRYKYRTRLKGINPVEKKYLLTSWFIIHNMIF